MGVDVHPALPDEAHQGDALLPRQGYPGVGRSGDAPEKGIPAAAALATMSLGSLPDWTTRPFQVHPG